MGSMIIFCSIATSALGRTPALAATFAINYLTIDKSVFLRHCRGQQEASQHDWMVSTSASHSVHRIRYDTGGNPAIAPFCSVSCPKLRGDLTTDHKTLAVKQPSLLPSGCCRFRTAMARQLLAACTACRVLSVRLPTCPTDGGISLT